MGRKPKTNVTISVLGAESVGKTTLINQMLLLLGASTIRKSGSGNVRIWSATGVKHTDLNGGRDFSVQFLEIVDIESRGQVRSIYEIFFNHTDCLLLVTDEIPESSEYLSTIMPKFQALLSPELLEPEDDASGGGKGGLPHVLVLNKTDVMEDSKSVLSSCFSELKKAHDKLQQFGVSCVDIDKSKALKVLFNVLDSAIRFNAVKLRTHVINRHVVKKNLPKWLFRFQPPVDPEDLYKRIERIGVGGFSSVYKYINRKTKRVVAIKIIELEANDDILYDVLEECAIMSRLKHRAIVEYQGAYVRGSQLYILMEYLGGGSVRDLLQIDQVTEQLAYYIITEIISALQYIHASGIIHHDVKASNMLLKKNGHVKISDFGVSRCVPLGEKLFDTAGTTLWMSPEMLKETGHDYSSDIWSLGITMYELIKGSPPYPDCNSVDRLYERIKGGNKPKLGNSASKNYADIMEKCLALKPEDRPSTAELKEATNWMKNAKARGIMKAIIDHRLNYLPALEGTRALFGYDDEEEQEQEVALVLPEGDKEGDTSNIIWSFSVTVSDDSEPSDIENRNSESEDNDGEDESSLGSDESSSDEDVEDSDTVSSSIEIDESSGESSGEEEPSTMRRRRSMENAARDVRVDSSDDELIDVSKPRRLSPPPPQQQDVLSRQESQRILKILDTSLDRIKELEESKTKMEQKVEGSGQGARVATGAKKILEVAVNRIEELELNFLRIEKEMTNIIASQEEVKVDIAEVKSNMKKIDAKMDNFIERTRFFFDVT